MNFLDLYKKIQSLDEGLSQGDMSVQAIGAAPSSPILTSEDEMCSECGGDMGPERTSSQTDSVSMNVSMSGSGKGGIRDLIDVLKNIEHNVDHDDQVIVGKASDIEVPMMGDEYANEPAPETAEIDQVIPTGNDLHSKGLEAEKQAGGGNPWRQMDVSESLVRRLSNHYAEVKDRVSEGYGRYRSPGSGMGWSQDAERRAFKRDELEHELRHEEDGNGWGIYIGGKFWKAVKSERQANSIVNTLQSKGKDAKASYGSYFESATDEGYGSRRYRSPGSGMGWSQDAEKRAFKRDELRHELGHEDEAAWREMTKPQLKGYYFYNIPPDTNPSDLKIWGLKQLKSGKWALPMYDKSGSTAAYHKEELDKRYGPGKWWAPKK